MSSGFFYPNCRQLPCPLVGAEDAALREEIGIATGTIFTLGDRYSNWFRLNAAFWSERIEQALETLGGIAKKMV